MEIKKQSTPYFVFYLFFALASAALMIYYLSNTIIHFTTDQQFPINSFERFPLSYLIFPAEVFSILFSFYFVYTLITDRYREKPLRKLDYYPTVAFLLPVYNEPHKIVERTLQHVHKVYWGGGKKIYLLDDSTKEPHISQMAALASQYGANIVRRDDRVGYKAGNINNGIKQAVREEFFVILDADQAPEPDFLTATMDYFSDPSVSFVQTPQYFIEDRTLLERAAKIGTNIFYQSMCVSKSRDKALPFCGTNAILRTSAFTHVGGFRYYSATEDIDLGIRMDAAGYHGVYVPKVVVKGYAPPTYEAYASQQYRWANGNVAILREYWKKLLFGPFSFRYQMHMLFTLGWWVIGVVMSIYILTPLLSLFIGGTHHTWLPSWILLWIYVHVGLGIGMIYFALKNRTQDPMKLTDALLQYSLLTNSIFIYARAAINGFLGRYVGFVTTDKKRGASGLGFIKWNLIAASICFLFSLATLFYATRGTNIDQVRTALPLSLWLLFYAVTLASSILFVGESGDSEDSGDSSLSQTLGTMVGVSQ